MGASNFYSTYQPQRSRHQSGYYRSTDEALVALLQSQQASLEKVCKHWHVSIHTTVLVFYLQILESRKEYRRDTAKVGVKGGTIVTKAELDKYWKHLNLNYVTEEFDDSANPNGVIEHKLPWRSKSKSFTTILRCDMYIPYFWQSSSSS